MLHPRHDRNLNHKYLEEVLGHSSRTRSRRNQRTRATSTGARGQAPQDRPSLGDPTPPKWCYRLVHYAAREASNRLRDTPLRRTQDGETRRYALVFQRLPDSVRCTQDERRSAGLVRSGLNKASRRKTIQAVMFMLAGWTSD